MMKQQMNSRISNITRKAVQGSTAVPKISACRSRISVLVAVASPRNSVCGNSRVIAEAAVMDRMPSSSSGPDDAASAVPIEWAKMSYSAQYDQIFSAPLNTKKVIPKPVKKAMEEEPGNKKVLFSDVHYLPKRPTLGPTRKWNVTDMAYAGVIGGIHLLACAAPFCFSPQMFALFVASYFVTGCLGITLSYHRQLSHKSFQTPKWLEYTLAYCGVLAVQGDPLEWASSHRYHHLHTDTPLDPHSPFEGFWWSHLGWLMDNTATLERVSNRGNADDLEAQPFYVWLQKTYAFHVVAQFAALFLLGGLPAVVWGGALRMVWVWHITWFVNSASHVWGYQDYNTGDLSRNNWWVGVLAFGEGWHNNHHAFEYSARHGFEWWQVDVTWGVISLLKAMGLATHVKLPTERAKAKLAFNKGVAPVEDQNMGGMTAATA